MQQRPAPTIGQLLSIETYWVSWPQRKVWKHSLAVSLWVLSREVHFAGPVRVVLDVGSAAPASPVYLVGSVESVRLHLATIQQPVLGLLVDREGDLDSNFATEVVPGLAAGFSSDVWEDVTRRVCSKHLVTIQEMIAERARETPDKLMLVFDEKHWTFKESLSLAGSLLGILEARGCSPEHGAVAVQMDASDLLVITYLALFCGGYVAHVVDGHPKTRAYKLS
eukprot:5595460-Amphidinium_carterae.1